MLVYNRLFYHVIPNFTVAMSSVNGLVGTNSNSECRSEMLLHGKSVHSWCDGLSDRSFMVDPLSYFSFQPVLHDWCNKGRGMYYPI